MSKRGFCDNCNEIKAIKVTKFVKGLDEKLNEFKYCDECAELLDKYEYPVCCECGKILMEDDDYEELGKHYICANCFYGFDKVVAGTNDYNFISKKYNVVKHPNGSWKTEINVIKPDDFEVIISEDLLKLCKSIEYQLKDSVEFSVLLKGQFDGIRFEVNADDYAIPKQSVSGASVDYEENLLDYIKDGGYNVHLHRHPSSTKVFSGADEKSTNVNFDCALLYCDGNITDASLRFKLNDNVYLKLKPKIKVKVKLLDTIEGIENIKKKEYHISKSIYYAL